MHLNVTGLCQQYTGEVKVSEIDCKQQTDAWVVEDVLRLEGRGRCVVTDDGEKKHL